MTLRGALPGRKPGTSASSTSSAIFSSKRESMSLRSTVTLMCFLHGPVSMISTAWLSFSCFSSFSSPSAGSVTAAGLSVSGLSWVSSVIGGYPQKSRKPRRPPPGPGGSRCWGLLGQQERVMGLEPTTATLATWRSTTELHPPDPHRPFFPNYKSEPGDFKRKFLHATTSRKDAKAQREKLCGLESLREIKGD